MSRRSRRDEDDEPSVEAWLAGGHEQPAAGAGSSAGHYQAAWESSASGPSWQAPGAVGSTGAGQAPDWDQPESPWQPSGPPWELPGAQDPYEHAGPTSSGHPSRPLPQVSPGTPDADEGWPPSGGGYLEPGFDQAGYGVSYTDTGAGYQNGTDDAGHGEEPYPAEGYDHGYPGGMHAGAGHGEADYPGGYGDDQGHPEGDYLGQDGYADHSGYGGYAGDAGYGGQAGYADEGYPAEDFPGDDEYPGYHEAAPGSGGREQDDTGYGDWYAGNTGSQSWEADDYEEDGEFVPGPGGETGSWDRPGRARGGRGDRRRTRRGMRRAAPWIAILTVLVILGVGGGGFLYVWRKYLHPDDYSGAGYGSVVVRVLPGDSAAAVGQRLVRLHVVASVRAFTNAAKNSGHGSSLEPGFYGLREHMSAALAWAALMKPSSRVQYKVVIPEGLRLSQIIARFGKATHDLAGYEKAVKDIPALNLPAAAHGNPEGYLFPDTYTVQPGTPPITVLKGMVAAFEREAASLNLPRWLKHDQVTEAQIITVASLVQAEGGRVSDFPKIARVIWNRLNLHMKLGLDSTVMYALHTYGIRASSSQIKVRSPYNTYQRYGLPPGPIDSPGDAAIRAALHAVHGSWLYFVTVNPKTGLTKFTSSYSQFQQYEAELSRNLAKG